jgi:D-alanyl-D-alanine carboxypeptidase (penicillin-binding protein 5/6)
MNVGRKYAEDDTIPYPQAEASFGELMNKKAKELGAVNSNFTNPHGFHDARHYTSARDMAIFAKAALENELIRDVVAEPEFSGPGAGDNPPEGALSQNYNVRTRNELILPGRFYYAYANGMKTGFTDEAGNCLVASASRDGRDYVAVVFFSGAEERFDDAVKLFDYGYDAYGTEVVQPRDADMGYIRVGNPRIGDRGYVSAYSPDELSAYLSKDELSRVEKVVELDKALVFEPGPGEENYGMPEFPTLEFAEEVFRAPIEKGQVVGKVSYYLDGEMILSADVVSGDEAIGRTFNTDVDHSVEEAKKWLFSAESVPYLAGAAGVLLLLIVVARVSSKRRRSRERGRYRWR